VEGLYALLFVTELAYEYYPLKGRQNNASCNPLALFRGASPPDQGVFTD
jgi:hypothetical protein